MALRRDYAQALGALAALEGLGMKLGLERIEGLLDALGNPHRRLSGVLVAGTNGKGSVCALVDAMARAAGLRTVAMTKPHLLSWCERIAVDGRPIEEQRFADLVFAVLDVAGGIPSELGSPTVFEVLTAAGIVAAAQAAPDLLICEVGLGGRLDSTNVLDLGVAAITTIALDHRDQLGDEVAGIAAEKAAIIKPGNDVVSGVTGIPGEVVRRQARAAGAAVVTETAGHFTGEALGRSGVTVTLSGGPDAGRHALELRCPLIGLFQVANVAVAALVARALRRRGLPIDDGAIARGAAGVSWPGRMQWIDGSPPLLIDGCHNTAAVTSMVETAPTEGRRTVVVFGVMADKDVDDMLEALRPLPDEVVFTVPATGRAMPRAELVRRWGAPSHSAATVAEALGVARGLAGHDGLVVACGSLYVAGEALEAAGGLTAGGVRTAF